MSFFAEEICYNIGGLMIQGKYQKDEISETPPSNLQFLCNPLDHAAMDIAGHLKECCLASDFGEVLPLASCRIRVSLNVTLYILSSVFVRKRSTSTSTRLPFVISVSSAFTN